MRSIDVNHNEAAIVSLDEIKQHSYISISVDDALLTAFEKAATRACESFLRRPILSADATIWYDRCDIIGKLENSTLILPLGRLKEVTSISLFDVTDLETEIDISQVQITIANQCCRIYFKNGISSVSSVRELNALKVVVVTSGFLKTVDEDEVEVVPEDLKLAIKSLTSYWYENREEMKEGGIPFHIRNLLHPYRIQRM